jgi:hypothetical protein
MKRIVESTDASGLEALLGEKVQVWCCNYFYAGVLSGINEHDIELTSAQVVYETGPLTSKFKDAQNLPGGVWYVRMSAIESYGLQP